MRRKSEWLPRVIIYTAGKKKNIEHTRKSGSCIQQEDQLSEAQISGSRREKNNKKMNYMIGVSHSCSTFRLKTITVTFKAHCFPVVIRILKWFWKLFDTFFVIVKVISAAPFLCILTLFYCYDLLSPFFLFTPFPFYNSWTLVFKCWNRNFLTYYRYFFLSLTT